MAMVVGYKYIITCIGILDITGSKSNILHHVLKVVYESPRVRRVEPDISISIYGSTPSLYLQILNCEKTLDGEDHLIYVINRRWCYNY